MIARSRAPLALALTAALALAGCAGSGDAQPGPAATPGGPSGPPDSAAATSAPPPAPTATPDDDRDDDQGSDRDDTDTDDGNDDRDDTAQDGNAADRDSGKDDDPTASDRDDTPDDDAGPFEITRRLGSGSTLLLRVEGPPNAEFALRARGGATSDCLIVESTERGDEVRYDVQCEGDGTLIARAANREYALSYADVQRG